MPRNPNCCRWLPFYCNPQWTVPPHVLPPLVPWSHRAALHQRCLTVPEDSSPVQGVCWVNRFTRLLLEHHFCSSSLTSLLCPTHPRHVCLNPARERVLLYFPLLETATDSLRLAQQYFLTHWHLSLEDCKALSVAMRRGPGRSRFPLWFRGAGAEVGTWGCAGASKGASGERRWERGGRPCNALTARITRCYGPQPEKLFHTFYIDD